MLESFYSLTDALILPGTPIVIFWIFVSIGMVMQGIGKSGFAGGTGILTFPLLSLVMHIDQVAAIMLPMLCLFDLNAIYHFRSQKNWQQILKLYPPCLIGIAMGAVFWWFVGENGITPYARPLKIMVGTVAILFATYILFKETILRNLKPFQPGTSLALAAGISAGFTSTLAHAAGPIVSLYIFVQGMEKSRYVGTVAWMFGFINFSKLPVYSYAGLFNSTNLKMTLFLFPLVPLGSYLGKFLHDRVNERVFNFIVMICVFISGIQLISDINVILWIFG